MGHFTSHGDVCTLALGEYACALVFLPLHMFTDPLPTPRDASQNALS